MRSFPATPTGRMDAWRGAGEVLRRNRLCGRSNRKSFLGCTTCGCPGSRPAPYPPEPAISTGRSRRSNRRRRRRLDLQPPRGCPWQARQAGIWIAGGTDLLRRGRGRREECPGILLFRKGFDTVCGGAGLVEGATDAPFTEGLVVFVVGEQPTGGPAQYLAVGERTGSAVRGNADPADANLAMPHVGFLGQTFG